jgi:Cell division protein CrgA
MPKASSRPDRPRPGRTTPKGAGSPGAKIGRYSSPEQSGRYTRPVPRTVRRSARWFGPTILVLMLFGILMILLNYLTVLPGSVSVWYLVAGLVIIFVAFIMATTYR